MAVFENRSGAYFMYVNSGSAENRHLQAALAIFGSGSYGWGRDRVILPSIGGGWAVHSGNVGEDER